MSPRPSDQRARRLALPAVLAALALVGALATGSCARESANPSDVGAAAAATFELTSERAMLWKVSARGERAGRLFLLGSVHALDQPLSLGTKLEELFERADVLVVEIELRAVTPETAAELFARYGSLAWGERLSDFISDETLAKLDAYGAEHGLPRAVVDRIHQLRPWAIAIVLEALQAQELGLKDAYGVDRYFLGRAGTATPVVGLETMDEQLFAMSSMSDATQEQMLLQTLEPTSTVEGATLLTLVDAWKAGDTKLFTELVLPPEPAEAPAGYDEFYETILFARNASMVDTLEELLEEGDRDVVYFVVVGAAHLVGEGSIPALLREQDYAVERVSN